MGHEHCKLFSSARYFSTVQTFTRVCMTASRIVPCFHTSSKCDVIVQCYDWMIVYFMRSVMVERTTRARVLVGHDYFARENFQA
ncbi:unnamed protein product [Leptosia nina]|uniref:Uncharacterized protein n=1 Tax=Leptosia nina TaxID=320188 RepID=A0AAV1J3F7_9NEOP